MSDPSVPDPFEQQEIPSSEISGARSFLALGDILVAWLRPRVAFDRFNIGLVDVRTGVFIDAYVHGSNVAGRSIGHRRPLNGTVVEAGIAAGDGIWVGGSPDELLRRFPRFGPVLSSGMRAMLATPIRGNDDVIAALVLASTAPDAFNDQALDLVRSLGAVSADRIANVARPRQCAVTAAQAEKQAGTDVLPPAPNTRNMPAERNWNSGLSLSPRARYRTLRDLPGKAVHSRPRVSEARSDLRPR